MRYNMAPPGEPPTVVDTADGPTPNGPVRNASKPWERAWNTEEMRSHSSNWTLAGDAGLLNFLQEFSQQMISKTHEVEKSLDDLIHETKVTSAKVSNTINDFHMLSNMQFVESRVYDEDISEETVAESKKPEQKTKEQKEAELLSRIKSALHLGIQVVEQAFNRVDIQQETDSEEEEEGGRPLEGGILLEPKDPYSHRCLPYIIGSKYFHDDDYVGLSDMLSEEELEEESKSKEYESDQSSEESESEREDEKIKNTNHPVSFKPPVRQHVDNISESGSSDLFQEEKQEKDKFSDTSFSAEDDVNEVERKKKQLPKFSEELAAKLRIPSTHPESASIDKNKEKHIDDEASIGSADNMTKMKDAEESLLKKKSYVGSSIHKDDEEDEEDDLFGPPRTAENSLFKKGDGLFSGGGNLFFDDQNEGDLFESSAGLADKEDNLNQVDAKLIEPPKKGRTSTGKAIYPGSVSIFGDVTDEVLKMPKSADISPTKQPTEEQQKEVPKKSEEKESPLKSRTGLFDGSEDEDDLFASLPKKPISSPKKGTSRNTFKSVGLFSDEDQVDGGIFEEIHTTHSSSSATPSDADPVKKIPVGGLSLFDDLGELGAAIKAKKPPGDTDSEDGSIPESGSKSSHNATKVPEQGDILKDSHSNSTSSSSIFTEDLESKDFFAKKDVKQTKLKGASLFGGDNTLFGDDDDLFTAKPSVRKPTGLSLYEDQDLFSNTSKKDEKSSKEAEPVKEEKKRTATHVSLFGDDDDDDTDDLFSTPVIQQLDYTSQKKDNFVKDTVDNILDEDMPPKEPIQNTQKTLMNSATKSLFEDDGLLFGGPVNESPDVDLFSIQTAGKMDQEEASKKPTLATGTVAISEDTSASKALKNSHLNSSLPLTKDSPAKKKPIGGVALFGGLDMFKDKITEVVSNEEPAKKAVDGEQRIIEPESVKVVEKISSHSTLKSSEELSVNFDKPVDISNTLSCASKDRVRIQARRRPPSRRGRQSSVLQSDSLSDSLSHSVHIDINNIEIQIQAKSELNAMQVSSSSLFETSETPSKKVLTEVLTSPSTEEEDVFTAVDALQKVVSPVECPKQKDLFSSSTKKKDQTHLESDSLFGPNSLSSTKSDGNIFSNKRKTAAQIGLETSDDIFADLTLNNTKLKTDLFSTIETNKKTADIFDSVDEDIFSTSSLSKNIDPKSKIGAKAPSEDDAIFKSSKKYSQTVDMNSEQTDIFADSSYDIFASIPVTEPVKLKSSSKPLFGSDDIDDLFAPVPKASPTASKLKERPSKKLHIESSNSSIFDDPLLGNQPDAND